MVHLPPLGYLSLVFFIIAAFVGTVVTDEEPLSVDADVTAIEIGHTAQLQCSTTVANEMLMWYRGTNVTADNLISQDDSFRVHANFTTGLLTVKDARENDTGEFLCRASSGSHSATAELRVYTMPSYLDQGMIIFGINAGLVMVFLGCGLYTFIQNRRSQADKTKHVQRVSTEL